MLGALLVLLLLGGAGPASAHAALRAADPADGSVLGTAPRAVTLTFTESVGLLDDSFRLFDPDGRRVRTGETEHASGQGNTARVSLPSGLGQGTYTVAWRVVSADSHPVSGAFTFSVGKPSPTTAAVAAGPVEDPVTGGLHTLARYAAYAAVALLVGTATFVLACRPPDPGALRGPLAAGWWVLLASTVVLVLLRAPYETGAGPAAAFDAEALGRTLTSRPGLALLARLALLPPTAVLLVRLLRRRGENPSRRMLAAGTALALGLALTWAAAEHASAGIQVPVAMTSSVLHLLAMAVWLGGLTALLTTLRRATKGTAGDAAGRGVAVEDPAGRGVAVEDPAGRGAPAGDAAGRGAAAEADGVRALTATAARFSRLALAAVTVLVVTGVYQSWRGLGSWTALTGTTYGRLLLAKVAVVIVLLAVASRSRRWTARSSALAEVRRPAAHVPSPEPAPSAAAASSAPSAAGVSSAASVKPTAAVTPTTAAMTSKEAAGTSKEAAGTSKEAAGTAEAAASSPALEARRRGLRRSVLAEVAVSVVVLGITTTLTGTLPGRAATEAADAAPVAGGRTASVTTIPFDLGTPGGHGTVQITLEPGRVGQNAVEAVVFGADGGLAIVPELRLSLSLPAKDIGPIDAGLTDKGGYWGTDDLDLPLAGTWTAKATVRTSELDQTSASRTIRILR
ncbi:copper resistance protein CopC [Streptomyces sp. NPDC046831]|uniref:copper resistance CopC/CopD family protein n=1 Tax=Streptomyces sp. NPDC046831 TaxID=3154805 RepID=UPI003403D6D6